MKKNITRYMTIENGLEEVEEKKYTAAPYAEFEKKDKDFLSVRIFYSTAANIPLYYALIISSIITLPMIFIQIFLLTPNFIPAMIIVLLILNLILFIPAILMRQYKMRHSFEFIFDKSLNRFTQLRIKSETERIKVFESELSEILHLEIKSVYIRRYNSPVGTTKHTIYLRFNDHSKIKFFYISYPNTLQILDYVLWICDFLNIPYNLTTPYARKVFKPKNPW